MGLDLEGAARRIGEAERHAFRKGRKGIATWNRVYVLLIDALLACDTVRCGIEMTWGRTPVPAVFRRGSFMLFKEAWGRARDLNSRGEPGWSPARAASAAGMIRAARGALDHARALTKIEEAWNA
jgi:hypothetical protein